MRIAGVIIAGGKGTRLGGDKPLRPFAQATLLDAVIQRVRPQVDALALNVSAAAFPRYRGYDLELIADEERGDIGPLAGVLAGLHWAQLQRAEWLATFPADTPFLPYDLVSRLRISARGFAPAAACDSSGLHGLCALWPTAAQSQLLEAVRNANLRSLREALTRLGGSECAFAGDADAFFNVNTPEDLARAERLAATSRFRSARDA